MTRTLFLVLCDGSKLAFSLPWSCCILLFIGLNTVVKSQENIDLKALLLEADAGFFSPYLVEENGYDIQLIYAPIDRNGDLPSIQQRGYNLHERYYYPASSIKLPIAVLALDYLNQLGIEELDMHSRLEHGAKQSPQQPAVSDSSAQNLYPSVAHYVRKIFLYSDNDAYNRLFELLGQRYINQRLQALGIDNTRLLHRVGISGFGPEENQWVNPIQFFKGDELLYFRGAARTSWQSKFEPEAQWMGKGYYKDHELINQPMDFSHKNYIPLASLLGVLQRVILPEAFPEEERFHLTAEQYAHLWKAMGQYPRESVYPPLPELEDGYVKFFLNGGAGDRVDNYTRILNKVGFAYGYLTDVAYIVDFKNDVEFFVAAVIHVNENRIFNDDTYEYEKGLQFLKRVGEVLLEYEKKKLKGNTNLSLKKYHDAIKY